MPRAGLTCRCPIAAAPTCQPASQFMHDRKSAARPYHHSFNYSLIAAHCFAKTRNPSVHRPNVVAVTGCVRVAPAPTDNCPSLPGRGVLKVSSAESNSVVIGTRVLTAGRTPVQARVACQQVERAAVLAHQQEAGRTTWHRRHLSRGRCCDRGSDSRCGRCHGCSRN